jgi:dihydrofolate reductase
VVLGSGALLQSLMQHDLVDEFLLSIRPLVRLRLTETKPTTGVIIARYELEKVPADTGATRRSRTREGRRPVSQ